MDISKSVSRDGLYQRLIRYDIRLLYIVIGTLDFEQGVFLVENLLWFIVCDLCVACTNSLRRMM